MGIIVKVLAIVQARFDSKRLPGKVLKTINGRSIIQIIIERLSQADEIDNILIGTSSSNSNNKLIDHLIELNLPFEIGSEDNVLDRYFQIAKMHSADVVVRITGDCPLVDANLVDDSIKKFKLANVDYLSNTINPSFPDGLDIEVFSFDSLEVAHSLARDPHDLEHVTPFIVNSGHFRKSSFENTDNLSDYRWTLDEDRDFTVIKKIFEYFHPNIKFGWKEVLELYDTAPEIFAANSELKRNEGMVMGSGQKLWRRAKNVIPGGNMLLSKRPEMFLPDKWPAYFSKSKGCKVWDLDGNEFTDMALMGVGTNILGYGHPEVDEAVSRVIKDGNMSSLNCQEEVILAEKLIELHPWAEMAKFARTGGEANAIAIRIARAASKKDNVAICGYHGWHDWYLAANIQSENNLDSHLLSGLDTAGVPRNLENTVFPFLYNDFEGLLKIVNENQIGTIKMEVMRNQEPKDDFLRKVRDLASERGIILVFDECTSGFRETFGGLHKKYGVDPDIAVFGKALGNGYAITAILGRREIMEVAQSTFISSTFWSERIGPAAAIKTLEVMEREKSWETITQIGSTIKDGWQKIALKHKLDLVLSGLPSLANFSISSPNFLIYKTYISQEMLKKNFLATTAVYASVAHDDSVINEYFSAIDPIFDKIKTFEKEASIDKCLEGPICHSGFSRLN